jgi:hypothetical protein
MLRLGRAGAASRVGDIPCRFAHHAIAACLALLVILANPPGTTAALRIADDHGGNIGVYWSRFRAVRDSNEQVIIDGTCSSACTLVLGLVPPRRICVTKNAVFGFHAAWRPGFLGLPVINAPATRTLLSSYPPAIQQWIARNGGLTDKMLYLSGRDLSALYHECR